MDIESPEAAEVLVRGIDSNAKALKDLIKIVKKMKGELGELKEKVEVLEKKIQAQQP